MITGSNNISGVYEVPQSNAVAALFTESSMGIFDTTETKPKKVDGVTKRGYVPWGSDNAFPAELLEKVRASDVMSPNMLFNILTGYGRGIKIVPAKGSETPEGKPDDKVKRFFLRNNPVKLLWEQQTDIKHFYFSVMVIILDKDGKKVLRMVHKEATYCRFESCNPKTGKIENVLFANWNDKPGKDDIEKITMLDIDDPWYHLLVHMGKEPDEDTGKKEQSKERKFAIVTKIPIPGKKYYPLAYYQSTFNSSWYDLSVLVPKAKKAMMENGMKVKYHVEIHKGYWELLFEAEGITDPIKQKARIKKEREDIQNFISGVENMGKVWISGYYTDPNGTEQTMVRIKLVDSGKAGGDYIEDAEEAANFICYAQGVHPSMNGATPGKTSGGLGGSDKRELFTMKQALEKPIRDLLLIPYQIVAYVNGWDIEFDIPDIMLTTLDKGTDAKEVSQNTPQKKEE